jgi:hypothetical protein
MFLNKEKKRRNEIMEDMSRSGPFESKYYVPV